MLATNSTFKIITLSIGYNIITSKQVFIIKFNIDSLLNKLKVRLIIRGFLQKFRVNYKYIFTPTLRHNILRIFFILVVIQDLEYYIVNINNAFIELFLKKDIYIKALSRMLVLKS